MHVDQEAQKAQGEEQKEHAEKKSDTEDMEVCEYTKYTNLGQIQMYLKACISNFSFENDHKFHTPCKIF